MKRSRTKLVCVFLPLHHFEDFVHQLFDPVMLVVDEVVDEFCSANRNSQFSDTVLVQFYSLCNYFRFQVVLSKKRKDVRKHGMIRRRRRLGWRGRRRHL